jgi:hypothetical protein
VDIEEALMLTAAYILGGLTGGLAMAVMSGRNRADDIHPSPPKSQEPKVNLVRCSCGAEFSFGSPEHSMPGNHLGHTFTYFHQPKGDDGKPK